MPRIRFLILRHQVWLLALLLVIFVCLLCNRGTSLLCPLFSWESIAGTCWGRQKKQVEPLFSYIFIIRFHLALHMMSFPYCIFFKLKKKKKIGRICRIFFLLAYQIIACIFSWYLNSLGINLLCLDIIESFWLYLPSVFLYMQKLDSFSSHAMKNVHYPRLP
jgi:hypothetical protein